MFAFGEWGGDLDERCLRVLDRAFSDACREAGIDPQPTYADTSRARRIRHVIASAVADAAIGGERDAGILTWVAFRKSQAAFQS